MEKDDDSNFSKKSKQIEMIWVDKIEIPVDLVVQKEVKKIPQVKSFYTGLYCRNLESSCVTILMFVKSARLEMSFVVLMRKMVPTSVLILEKGIKTDQLKRGKKSVQVYVLSLCNE